LARVRGFPTLTPTRGATTLPSPLGYVEEMRERIERIMPLVKEHLIESQRTQQQLHDQPKTGHPGWNYTIVE